MSNIKFSLLMSVYINDDVEAFSCAMESILKSTVIPDDVCIVLDGPIGVDKEDIIRRFSLLLPINYIRLPNNVGLGRALSTGLTFCKHEWIARFDSDDICHPRRFEEQLAFLSKNQSVDIIGTWVGEFESAPDFIHAIKKVPVLHLDIIKFAKSRNPFNHMSVMYKKSSVLAAGGYQDDYLYEDYTLWVRMIQNKCMTANIPEVLVYARTGNGMEVRRGGLKYVKSEIKAQCNFHKLGFLSRIELVKNLAIRVPVRLLPGSIRKYIYRKTLRR
ncbi:TPA: glycosyltransferase [Aeromonas veronii]